MKTKRDSMNNRLQLGQYVPTRYCMPFSVCSQGVFLKGGSVEESLGMSCFVYSVHSVNWNIFERNTNTAVKRLRIECLCWKDWK
jgi:hypothetical protein